MSWDPLADLQQDRELMREELAELKTLGIAFAQAEAAYYSVKTSVALELKADGNSGTVIQMLIKGDRRVNEAMLRRDIAKAKYEASQEALNVYKLDARLMEAQLDREYRG